MADKAIDFSISTPGKIILHGEHSVVYGKTALAASVNLKTKLIFLSNAEKSTSFITLDLPCVGLKQQFQLKDLCQVMRADGVPLLAEVTRSVFSLSNPEMIDFDKLLEKAKMFLNSENMSLSGPQENAVLSFLCLFCGMFSSVDVPIKEFYINVTSELDMGAGMGSSTAYNICLVAAFLHFIRRSKLHHLGGKEEISKAGYKSFKYWTTDLTTFEKGELDLISRWGHLGDKIMHGNPSGIDNAVCTYGSIIEFRKGSTGPDIKMIPDPKFLKILLVNSKVQRNTKKLVGSVASLRDRFASVVEPILDAMDSVALTAAETLRRMNNLSCNHNGPNNGAIETTLSKEMTKLEGLIDINQKLLEALGVSHAALESICEIAKMEGLHGKLTGAGGGGYAFVMIPLEDCDQQLCAIRMNYESHQFPARQVTLGGPGVTLAETYDPKAESESVYQSLLIDSLKPDGHPEKVVKKDSKVESRPSEKKIAEPPEGDDDLGEWPWSFDVKEMIRKALESELQQDLQSDEIAVPVSKLCAKYIPEPLPQWMEKIGKFQNQIAPTWQNVINEGYSLFCNWKSGRESDRKTETFDVSDVEQFYEYSEDAATTGTCEVSLPISGSKSKKRTSDLYKKKRMKDRQTSMEQMEPTECNLRLTRSTNDNYILPRHADFREELFGQFDRPTKWLIQKFPPYGKRVWTYGSKFEERVKQELESLVKEHTKFLKSQKEGCEIEMKNVKINQETK